MFRRAILVAPFGIDSLTMSWRCRFVPVVKTCRAWINPKDPNCYGLRAWWLANQKEIMYLNPGLDFSIEETPVGEPVIDINYQFNDRRVIRAAGATAEEMEEIMKAVVDYGVKLAPKTKAVHWPSVAVVDKGHREPDGHAGPTAEQRSLVVNFDLPCTVRARMDPYLLMNRHVREGLWDVRRPDDPGQLPKRMPHNGHDKLVI